ncbi:MAG: permease prefix domain 1-containing protein [Defluviitaleaceae bacterium]|nr:permease prefix domain 1-containing protein [Defluviitaleaceae bacterium]
MYEKLIAKWVNNLFYDVEDTNEAREQKEELRIHLMERVEDYMKRGLPFDEAFAIACDSLGDPEELTSGFERRKPVVVEDFDDDYGFNFNFRVKHFSMKMVSLSPFIYVLLGVTQNRWMAWMPFDLPNWWWWAVGWMIIPVFGILSSDMGRHTIVAIAPFAYIFIGFLPNVSNTWWLWGWVIIPIAGILFSGGGGKKKKKKRKKIRARVIGPWIDDELGEELSSVGHEIAEAVQEVAREVKDAVYEVRDDLNDEFGRRN